MPPRASILLAVVSMLVSCSQGGSHRAKKLVQPSVAMYSIDRFAGTSKTRQFILSEDKSGYDLTTRTGKVIAKDVFYMKTIGGAFGAISVHLVQDRFVVYPETVEGSEIPDTLFHERKAVTHVYDLKRGKILTSSEPYRYDHDVPLRYDAGEIWRLSHRVDEEESGRSLNQSPDS